VVVGVNLDNTYDVSPDTEPEHVWASVPYHAFRNYSSKLIRLGDKVIIIRDYKKKPV
jgi:DNA mismatch repair ATPase MutS